jgi:hypothetical protein
METPTRSTTVVSSWKQLPTETEPVVRKLVPIKRGIVCRKLIPLDTISQALPSLSYLELKRKGLVEAALLLQNSQKRVPVQLARYTPVDCVPFAVPGGVRQ